MRGARSSMPRGCGAAFVSSRECVRSANAAAAGASGHPASAAITSRPGTAWRIPILVSWWRLHDVLARDDSRGFERSAEAGDDAVFRAEEHTSALQSRLPL